VSEKYGEKESKGEREGTGPHTEEAVWKGPGPLLSKRLGWSNY
jgi:hypothetical protein